ncbi:M56 family metallopeptidase [Streptomyces sp. ODS28]|uniref:M56 family metallopeptidase n=1 Tax=Streptomyces sp. ODS28 TaxID=3136688 RepID=UPI0031EB51C2
MRIDVYLPLVLSLLLAAVAPQVGKRMAPAPAARALTAAAVLTAAATAWALALLAFTLLDVVPPVAAEAHEHGRSLPDPVPEAIAVLALGAFGVLAHRFLRALRGEFATRRALRRLREGHPGGSELIVADSAAMRAFAVPGRPGRILVTAGMLGALDPAERRILLAHERAHLTHRHARIVTAVTLAAAANPLLDPVRGTVAYLVERWADEHAAHAVGDRSRTARTLARVALLAQQPCPAQALGFSEHAVLRRVTALQSSPPPRLWPIGAAVLALGIVPALGAADATSDFLTLLAHAFLG